MNAFNRYWAVCLLIPGLACAAGSGPDACLPYASRVTITRDDWGVAHIKGPADADAVFGMMYAQAEDDFARIERNYLVSLGRLAEAEGEAALWQDLRQRLFIDPVALKADYQSSAPWLQKLMQAWAAGLNCYLASHPQVRPRVLEHFEPWMPLAFSEGSIGGDIESISLVDLAALYGGSAAAVGLPAQSHASLGGSNGFAIAPDHTRDGHALLLINPHTSFFFRAEQHVSSDEGLNVYGAATWGQFFIYQGFNERAGWMHTSSGVDNIDEFAETITTAANGERFYRYGSASRALIRKDIMLAYRGVDGASAKRRYTVFFTQHGPLVRQAGGKLISVALMNRPLAALEQSYLRTKARDYRTFIAVAERQANSSNNTIFADRAGEIAYLHPQFVPIRNDRFDYRAPVDGSDPATDWNGLHTLASLPQAVRPANGWVMNTNNAPWTAAGADSPRAANYPRYMDQAGEDPRGPHAEQVLNAHRDFTPETLMAAAYDPYLTAFARYVPLLVSAYERLGPEDPLKQKLASSVELLHHWDFRWALDSKATSLAVFFGDALTDASTEALTTSRVPAWDYLADHTSDAQKLEALSRAVDTLVRDFGSSQVPWGEINRFQRNDGAIVQKFDDAKPSTPVAFTSADYGSLAAFEAKRYPGTHRYYGTSGNSFVAVVEFGPRLRAWAVTAGGESGHPDSPHFTDQAQRYADGQLRVVYFYPDQLKGHVETSYRPGAAAARKP